MKLAAAAAVALFAGLAQGQSVIASWDTTGNAGNSATLPVDTVAANVSATAWTRGPGIDPSSASNTFSSDDWGGTAEGAASDEYFSVTLTPDAGWQFTLDSLVISTRSSNTGPGTLGLFTSLDGFTNEVFTFVQNGDDFNNFDFGDIDLSGLGVITSAVEFRIIEIGNTQADGVGTTSNGGTFRIGDSLIGPFDPSNFIDVQFTGEVSLIPTPGAFGLAAVAGLAAARRRRNG